MRTLRRLDRRLGLTGLDADLRRALELSRREAGFDPDAVEDAVEVDLSDDEEPLPALPGRGERPVASRMRPGF